MTKSIIAVKKTDDFYKKVLSIFVEHPDVQRLQVDFERQKGGTPDSFNLYAPKRSKQRFIFYEFWRPLCVGVVEQKEVASYVGTDVTCQEINQEFYRLVRGQKTFFLLAANGVPLSGVDKKSMTNFVLKEWPHIDPNGVVKWLIEKDGTNTRSQKDADVLQQITKDIVNDAKNQKYHPFLPISLKKINGMDVITVRNVKNEFVVGYDNKIVVLPYVLGGLRAIEKSAFLHRLNRSSEIRER